MKKYAGIGSRKTPEHVCDLMERIGFYLAEDGWLLRSGGAHKADTAFQSGVESFCSFNKSPKDYQEIFIPWNGFNGWNHDVPRGILLEDNPDAERIAREFHPAWEKLSNTGRQLITRNGYQILGKSLNQPVKFVICWTSDQSIGKTTPLTGGTGHALRIAYAYNIPIYNLSRVDHFEKLSLWCASSLLNKTPKDDIIV